MLIKTRVAKLICFIRRQARNNDTYEDKRGLIVACNIFRALQMDVSTACAFSQTEGTNFLDKLTAGPNTMNDIGMDVMDLYHDEKQQGFFFWESEAPFRHISHLIARSGPIARAKAQAWVSELISRYETNEKSREKLALLNGDYSIYGKIWIWNGADRGRRLDREERASEILDHIGKANPIRNL